MWLSQLPSLDDKLDDKLACLVTCGHPVRGFWPTQDSLEWMFLLGIYWIATCEIKSGNEIVVSLLDVTSQLLGQHS